MFRSLFIGFLILSALTSKGAGYQINQNITNISADTLFELFNAAAAHAEKQAELSDAGTDGVLLNNASGSFVAIEELLKSIRQGSPVVWDAPDDKINYPTSLYSIDNKQQKRICTGEIYFYSADPSPPDCRLNCEKK